MMGNLFEFLRETIEGIGEAFINLCDAVTGIAREIAKSMRRAIISDCKAHNMIASLTLIANGYKAPQFDMRRDIIKRHRRCM